MFYPSSSLFALAPTGDPSVEALHREDFMTHKPETAQAGIRIPDHRAAARSRTLRAGMAARVSSFFSAA